MLDKVRQGTGAVVARVAPNLRLIVRKVLQGIGSAIQRIRRITG